jgi:hypothetical protein
MKRIRTAGVTDPVTGKIVPFPRIPKVPAAEWRRLSPAGKVERLIGFDRCYEILSWGPITADPLRQSFQWQVMRVLFPIHLKALLDGTLDSELARERDRERILEELNRKMRARSEPLDAAPGA